MQEIIASVDHIKFDLEIAVEQQLGAQPLPFPGMDKSGAAVCEFFLKAACGKGGMCPFRHISGEKTVVCKHWLRGLCKKGDQCEFLHEYDMTKMPECYFYSKFGECSNKECPFLHIDPESKIKDCPWYDRGFCKHGPLCRHRHTRRVICVNYLVGFCPEGPSCKFMHTLPRSQPGVAELGLSPGVSVLFSPLSCGLGGRDEPTATPCPALDLNCRWEPPSSPHCRSRRSLRQSREPRRSSGSCRVKTAVQATGDPGRWSRSPVTSVVKKDTTPTDAPKGIWPFSVDSDSSWSQLKAAQGPCCWGPLQAILGSVHLTV
ncbi:PREDICTED: cleavage and polyadenylation specificity factor subunit 4 isoform X1 [Hipposideros armiger]|uniref:Cleavage and polyadenylation specificity factor subunit 4 n=1 Tax=Hipposideros armiger TaxID=186990 RepID=A0A8B7QQ09_HIPAR|nr:PREDICTED: cleavage and polyadenylation specificity factor subunit 4 isoform X1 [Hipposideros armiger]